MMCAVGGVVWARQQVSYSSCSAGCVDVNEWSHAFHGDTQLTQPWWDLDVRGHLRTCSHAIIDGGLARAYIWIIVTRLGFHENVQENVWEIFFGEVIFCRKCSGFFVEEDVDFLGVVFMGKMFAKELSWMKLSTVCVYIPMQDYMSWLDFGISAWNCLFTPIRPFFGRSVGGI